ncbi:MAG: hypothetical protein WCY88_03610 [Spongiibacteraceae bacterium]
MSESYSGRLPPPPPAPLGQALARDIFGNERDGYGNPINQPAPQSEDINFSGSQTSQQSQPKEKATDALGRRAGSLLDEIDFPTFVSSLLQGTFDAIVDSSIRQMEAYADLVAAVAKPLDQFTQENVTLNQARDWLAEQYPSDVRLEQQGSELLLTPVANSEEEFSEAPSWLADFGHEGEELNQEFLEETLLPLARERVAQQRLSTLATMVLTGMNRVVVKDGSVGARLRFRASAADTATVQYATSNDPSSGATEWGRRGTGRGAVTKVSTVDVNAQSDTELEAHLYGDVKINFASETLPLDRFVDQAQQALLERHSRMRHSNQPRATASRAQPPAAAPLPAPQTTTPISTPAATPVPAATDEQPSSVLPPPGATP